MSDFFALRIRKSSIASTAVLAVSLLSVLIVIEIALRVVWPQEYMRPTYMYSNQYVNSLFPNTTMVEEKPGEWKFNYTINSYGYRGKLVKPSNRYSKNNIVVLGDSYTFGEGVEDGDEYAAELGRQLEGQYDVINLGVPGWGLTQEIRRYYEFGVLFRPKIVILQFSGNDPLDNLAYPVARIADDRFVFEDTNLLKVKRLNKWLADSFVQRLQIYNFIKQRLWRLYATHQRSKLAGDPNRSDHNGIPIEEENHIRLLNLLVKSVTEEGIHVIFLPVGDSLRRFTFLSARLRELSSRNELFHFMTTNDWFDGVDNYSSPEGHNWGEKAHAIVGRRLADYVNGMAPSSRLRVQSN